MIKKMERRFTIVAISVISLVLLFLVLAVQLISNQVNIRKADIILSSIADESASTVIGNMGSQDLEALRSFSVELSNDGSSETIQMSGIGLVEEELAFSMSLDVLNLGEERGFIEGYRYLIVHGEHLDRVYFLDYSFEQDSANSLLWVSLAVYSLSVLLVAVLVKVFMKFVMRPIKESYEKQKQFITDASHELKTPLTVISTNMQLIEMEAGSTKWVKSVNRQVERLTSLSNDLVELSKMDEESTQMILKNLNLSDLASDVVYGFEPALLAEGKELQVEIAEDIKIDGAYDGLEKVMSILMENALKYTSKDGLVKVALSKNNKGILLSVENTVDKIDEGSHSEYFERFYRADKSRNSKTGGFGVGLAIAKSIVEQHKGEITAFSPDFERIIFQVKL